MNWRILNTYRLEIILLKVHFKNIIIYYIPLFTINKYENKYSVYGGAFLFENFNNLITQKQKVLFLVEFSSFQIQIPSFS